MGCGRSLLQLLLLLTLCRDALVNAGKVRRNQFNVYNVNVHASASDLTISSSNGRLTLLRAQCKAVCMRRMTEHDQTLSEAQKVVLLSSEKLMEMCMAKQTCAACERGCNTPLAPVREQVESTAPIVCPQQCKVLPENLVKPCTDSCRLLGEMMDERKVVESVAASRQNVTSRKCTVNFDCAAPQRCCKRHCGTCDQTVPFPTILDVNERENTDANVGDRRIGFDVEWTVPDNIPVDGPIVYVLDVRSFFGSAFDEDRASPWKTLLMTTNKGAYLGGIRVGELYRFRLAAVSPDGTQGYSTPTQPRRSSVEPQAPSTPENLREEARFMRPSGVMDVQFSWEPPAESDLEVTKYKLFWFQKSDIANGRVRASREVKKTVPASQMSFLLEDLQTDTVYCFAVQALCDFSERKLRSQRSVVCVNTSSEFSDEIAATTLVHAPTTPGYNDDSEELDITQDYADWDLDNDNHISTTDDEYDTDIDSERKAEEEYIANELSSRTTRPPFTILNGSLSDVYYENDALQASISWNHNTNSAQGSDQRVPFKYTVIWRPLVCSDGLGENMRPHTTASLVTESRNALLDGLRFACQYQVVLRLLANSDSTGNETSFTFNTPRCTDVQVRDGRRPVCATATTQRPTSAQTIHSPKNVQVRLIESWTRQSWTKYYHAYVNWTASTSTNVHSYRIVYGRKTIQSPSNAPKMEKGSAITKVITTTYTSLLDLEADTTYVIQLQALSDSGDSRVTQVHFTTVDPSGQPRPVPSRTAKAGLNGCASVALHPAVLLVAVAKLLLFL